MISLSNIYKANAVTIDTDNVINIETNFYIEELPYEPEPVYEIAEEENPEETARSIIQNALDEAEKQLEEAKALAEKIINDAKQQAYAEAAEIKSKAYDSGYGEGYEKAEEEGKAIVEEAETVLSDANAERARLEETLEPEMVKLAIDVIEKLLGDVVKLHPEVVLNLIRQGIAGAKLSGQVQIRVSPSEYEAVTNNQEVFSSFVNSSVSLEIVRDPALGAMDCVIETPFGNIDCSLSRQYEALREQLVYITQTNDQT